MIDVKQCCLGDNEMKHKHVNRWATLLRKMLLILCLAAFVVTSLSYARERRTVKVAFFPMDGYHIFGEGGTYGGIDTTVV